MTTTQSKHTNTTQQTVQQQQLQQQQQQQQQTQQQPQEQADSNTNNQNNNNTQIIIPKESKEPNISLPSSGSTGQPRSFQQTFDKEALKETCGDQNKPTQPPKPRNTNRGIRNPNTVEIRREKRTNKRRVARRQNRKEGGGTTQLKHRGVLRPWPRNP
jgi:hypothetical protein